MDNYRQMKKKLEKQKQKLDNANKQTKKLDNKRFKRNYHIIKKR